eukprot:gene667-842_t
MENKRFCLITNDVETTSILNHKLRDKTGQYVLEQGYIAKLYPEVVKMAQAK